MKKTIPTSIAQTLFYIEEDSYQKLDNYLTEIRKYFDAYEDKIEIIQDIESRIREQLLQFSEEEKTERIITEAHIDRLIKNMGWPKEFGVPETDHTEHAKTKETDKKTNSRRRLYRDKDNAIIGGVASGIAVYFGIDPVIMRILFFVSIFFGGAGIFIYLILWLVLPVAETATEILEMQGDPMNLDEVKKLIEEKIHEVGDKEKIKNNATHFFEQVRNGLLKFGGKFFKIIFGIAGVCLKIVSLFGIALMFVFMFIVLMSSNGGDMGQMFTQFNSLPYFYVLSFFLFLIGLIPFIFLNRIGSLFLGRELFRKTEYASILFALWVIVLILGPVIFLTQGNEYVQKIRSGAYDHERTVWFENHR